MSKASGAKKIKKNPAVCPDANNLKKDVKIRFKGEFTGYGDQF